MKPYWLAILLFSTFIRVNGQQRVINRSNFRNFGFIENKGQIVDQEYKTNTTVKYLLCSPGINIQLKQTGFSYDTYIDEKDSSNPFLNKLFKTQKLKSAIPVNYTRQYHRVDIKLLNCNPSAQIDASCKSESYSNYFTAGTPEDGISYVYKYKEVIYKNIYPHIDLEFLIPSKSDTSHKNAAGFEYQFILHSGANVDDIKMEYKGADKVNLVNGELLIKVSAGTFTENIPSSYFQENKQPIDVKYTIGGNNVFSFSLPKNIHINSDIIIDPTPCLDWGTFYGSDMIGSRGIAVDTGGNVYITGETHGTSNIATAGAYQTVFGGNEDTYIAKFNSNGSSLVWATYYGGSRLEFGEGIALDSHNNVYITGHTESSTNIATPGAYQTINGGANVFVAKFNPTGSTLLWGTYYGGTNMDISYGISLDKGDNVYITGSTGSTTNIATVGAYQTTYGPMFVAKFNPTGSSLLWGTYYGGTGGDAAWGIALDDTDNVYITGSTYSNTKIATPGAYQSNLIGSDDAFAAKFNPSGTSLLWGTYYGEGNSATGIALDPSNNVYLVGTAFSPSFIATPGAYQTIFGGSVNAFVAKFNPTGSSLLWGTYYGGVGNTEGLGIAVDSGYNAYVTGPTAGSTNISTTNAYHTNYSGGDGSNAYIGKFNTLGNLVWGTYYGGANGEEGVGIALDSKENVYFTGLTLSKDSIATPGAYETINSAKGDSAVFVAKFGCNSYCNLSSVNVSGTKLSICVGDTSTLFISGGKNFYTYLWSPGGQTNTTIHISPSSSTTYTLLVKDTLGGCVKSITTKVSVIPIPNSTITGKDTICIGGSTFLTAKGGAIYSWSNGRTSDTITVSPAISTTFSVSVGNGVCTKDTSVMIIVDTNKPIPIVSVNQSICRGDSIKLMASGGATYNWIPSTSLSSSVISSPIATPVNTITYTVIIAKGICKVNDSIKITVIPEPTITIEGNHSICSGDSIVLNATGGGTYTWSNGASTDSILVKPGVSTTYTVQVINTGCPKDTSFKVVVDSLPIPSIAGNKSICIGKSITLTASGGIGYNWSTGAISPSIIVNPELNTNYIVTVSNGPCSAKDSIEINVNPLPISYICCDSIINAGQTVNLIATGGVNYSWVPLNGLSCINCPSPIANPLQTTTYSVTVISDSGCSLTEMVTIEVNCHIFIPDAFSPNGDGQNDYLYVRGDCIKTMDFKIFDRWGNKVFESADKNIPWDGTFKGQPMNTDTFVYYLDATTYDGKTITKKGNVALIR
ncbi:MAG TPA: SBBP repeat-containing protein [Bacteroidia bacterium]|nr:SBBP repeat-containing protein [Bacteroidia bacterium]